MYCTITIEYVVIQFATLKTEKAKTHLMHFYFSSFCRSFKNKKQRENERGRNINIQISSILAILQYLTAFLGILA